MTNKEYVLMFNNIRLSKICKDLKINQSNVKSGMLSEENYRRLKESIEKELIKLYINKTNSEKIMTIYLYNEILERLEKENRLLREMI